MAEEEQTKEGSLEDNFKKLEELIGVLDREDATLEEAFAAYSKGVELVKKCNDQIDRVEKKVQLLMEDGTTEDFQ